MSRHSQVLFLSVLTILLIVFNSLIIRRGLLNNNYLDTYKKPENKNFTIHIEVDKKVLHLIDSSNHKIIKDYNIATGKTSSPTPLGTFFIVEKGRWGEGFGSRWIGLNIPWGKYGIHGTNRPSSIGANVSGGCVRMRNSDVEDLYDRVGIGSAVVITNGYYGPFGNGLRNLRPGDRGADVLEVQKRLKILGYYDSALDGIYGESMKKSLIKFLKDKNIPLTDEISGNIYEKLGIILMD
jgi:hypothetical protein